MSDNIIFFYPLDYVFDSLNANHWLRMRSGNNHLQAWIFPIFKFSMRAASWVRIKVKARNIRHRLRFSPGQVLVRWFFEQFFDSFCFRDIR